jgi:hypothetical protein
LLVEVASALSEGEIASGEAAEAEAVRSTDEALRFTHARALESRAQEGKQSG